MNLFTNPEFLKSRDTFYFKTEENVKIEYGKFYDINFFKYNNNNFRFKSDFSPVTTKFTSIIEYIEGDPVYLNGFGMPSTLTYYSLLSQNFSFHKNNLKKRVIIESDDDLPLLCNLKNDGVLLIQETNLFSSILKNNPQINNNNNNNNNNQEDEMFIIITFIDNNNNKPPECFIKVDNLELFLSGHIQLKVECGVTFPKQEKIIFGKQRKNVKNVKNLKNLKNLKKNFISKRVIPKVIPKVIPNFIQIKSVRELQINIENKKMEKFFKYFIESKTFNDVNNILIILYTMSCFILNNNKLKEIFIKIENFINSMNWTQSINFFNSTDRSKLGKSIFLMRLFKIFTSYFNEFELTNYDDNLLNYVKNFNKEMSIRRKNKNKNKNTFVENIENKRIDFINTKRKIIKFIYFLESKYLLNSVHTTIFQKEINKDEFDEFFKNLIFQKEEKDKISINNSIIIEDDDLESDFILQSCGIYDFDYKPTDENLRILNNSEIFDLFTERRYKKIEGKTKKVNTKKTKLTQLRYSNIFFEDAPTTLKIHPNIKEKLSNPLKVFLDYDKDKKRKKNRKKNRNTNRKRNTNTNIRKRKRKRKRDNDTKEKNKRQKRIELYF